MSGRVRWRRNGEVVTGYRKTDRRRSPARPLRERLHEIAIKGEAPRPEVRLAFLLPKTLQGFIASGDHGAGVDVLANGFVRVTRWSAEECFKRAQTFFRDIAKERPAFTVQAVIVKTDEPGMRYHNHLTVVRGALVVYIAAVPEPRVFEAA